VATNQLAYGLDVFFAAYSGLFCTQGHGAAIREVQVNSVQVCSGVLATFRYHVIILSKEGMLSDRSKDSEGRRDLISDPAIPSYRKKFLE